MEPTIYKARGFEAPPLKLRNRYTKMNTTRNQNHAGPYVPERMLCQMLKQKMHSSLLHPSRGASYQTSPIVTRQQDEILLYCESSLTLLYDLKRSSTVTDVSLSLGSFFRGITQTSVTGTLINVFVKISEELSDELPFFQSSSWIDVLDDFHKNLHRVRDSVLGKKTYFSLQQCHCAHVLLQDGSTDRPEALPHVRKGVHHS